LYAVHLCHDFPHHKHYRCTHKVLCINNLSSRSSRIHNIAKYPFTKHRDEAAKYYHITSVRMHTCERLLSHFLGDCNKISICSVHDLHTSPSMTNLLHLVRNIMIFTSSKETTHNFFGATGLPIWLKNIFKISKGA